MLTVFRTSFKSKKQLAQDVYLFRFKLMEPNELSFSAGQYMIMEIPQADNTVKRRFISIASPQQDTSEFEGVMKIIPGGVASTFLLGLKKRDQVHFQGPSGMFTFQNNSRQNIFIATGTGIGPIRSIVKSQFPCLAGRQAISNFQTNPKSEIPNLKPQMTLLCGLKTINSIYFFDELKEISQKNPQFSLKICLSQEKSLDTLSLDKRKFFVLGRVTRELDNLTTNYKLQTTNFEFYIFGAKELVDSLREYLLEKGVNPKNIHTERFI